MKLLIASNLIVSSQTPAGRTDTNYFDNAFFALKNFLEAAKEKQAIPVMVGRSFERLSPADAIRVVSEMIRSSQPVLSAAKQNNLLVALRESMALQAIIYPGDAAIINSDIMFCEQEGSNTIDFVGKVVGFNTKGCDLNLWSQPIATTSCMQHLHADDTVMLPHSMRYLSGAGNEPFFVLYDMDRKIPEMIPTGYSHDEYIDRDFDVRNIKDDSNSLFTESVGQRFSAHGPLIMDLAAAIDDICQDLGIDESHANYAKSLLIAP